MLHFDSIIDFIDVLYKEKKILEFLFEKRRKEVMSDQILSLIDYNEDRLNALLLQKVLIERVNSIELNHDLNGFFEKTLQITEEINNEYTSGLLKNLATKMELVRASKKLDDRNNYIRETVNTLDKIGQNLLQNINQIRINIEDVYSTATNNAVRKIKLKDYDEKTKEIDILIDEVYSLLKSNRWESFLKIAENDDLWNATIFLQKMLTKVRQNSYDIAHKLTAFHNKIKLQAAIYKKLQKIKLLKDKYLLKENTNIEQLLESRGTLFFSPQQHYQYHLNIPFLQTDEGGDLILKTNKKYHKHTSSISEIPAQEIASKATESKVKQVQVFSLQHLKQIFVAGNGSDLFAFLLDFDFQTEVSFEKKVTLFCQIVSRYSDELQDAKQYKTINNVEYAVFASKKIKK